MPAPWAPRGPPGPLYSWGGDAPAPSLALPVHPPLPIGRAARPSAAGCPAEGSPPGPPYLCGLGSRPPPRRARCQPGREPRRAERGWAEGGGGGSPAAPRARREAAAASPAGLGLLLLEVASRRRDALEAEAAVGPRCGGRLRRVVSAGAAPGGARRPADTRGHGGEAGPGLASGRGSRPCPVGKAALWGRYSARGGIFFRLTGLSTMRHSNNNNKKK